MFSLSLDQLPEVELLSTSETEQKRNQKRAEANLRRSRLKKLGKLWLHEDGELAGDPSGRDQ